MSFAGAVARGTGVGAATIERAVYGLEYLVHGGVITVTIEAAWLVLCAHSRATQQCAAEIKYCCESGSSHNAVS
tara:strand:+ start:3021 stop:3242 length:222 start_codon:yes stop_codon:yes gene_type:complete